jgi:adenosine deaminase
MSAAVSSIISASQETSSLSPCLNFQTMSLSAIMQTQKYADLLKEIKKIHKTELHAHLGGAVPLEFLQKHCTASAYTELLQQIERIKTGEDYSKAFNVFDLIGKILTTNERIEEAAYLFCQGQAADLVTLTEVRTGLKDLGTGFEGYLQAVLSGLKQGQKDFRVKVNLVLSLRRNTSAKDAEETVRLAIKYRYQGITGIDISGESTKGDCSTIFESIDLAKKHGFPVTLHIGEHPSENPEQQMKELSRIEPQRIGHAVHLCPQAKQWVDAKRPVIEACIKSALSVKMITLPADHPAFLMLKNGHQVVFCTDDSTLFDDHSSELAVASCLLDLTSAKVQAMQLEAQKYVFA